MEIIEKGNLEYGYTNSHIEVVCTGISRSEENAERKVLPCGARLKAGLRDVFNLPNGKGEPRLTIKCPICGALTYVNGATIPEGVRRFVEIRTEADVDNDPFRTSGAEAN